MYRSWSKLFWIALVFFWKYAFFKSKICEPFSEYIAFRHLLCCKNWFFEKIRGDIKKNETVRPLKVFVKFPKKFWAQYDENCELCFILRFLGETLSNSFSESPREPLKTHFRIDKTAIWFFFQERIMVKIQHLCT